jgi:plasmid maintenance system antidote protein VapI
LFDALLQSGQARNDAHIADLLGVGKVTIHDIRHERRPVSGDIRCAIMRTFGLSLKRIDELAPPKRLEGEQKGGA